MSEPIIHVIGCGGIGSYLIEHLAKLRDTDQLVSSDGSAYSIHIYDDDEVEQKNLAYQNFTNEDELEPKAEVLGKRYSIYYQEARVDNISNIIFSDRDIIIIAVDTINFRKKFFQNQDNIKNFWIDLRCHGRFVMYYTRDEANDEEYLMKTLPEEMEEGSGGCQRQADLDAGIIQMGNRIIAPLGAQALLNHIRDISQMPRFIHQF